MEVKLPAPFRAKMKSLLGAEYDGFEASYGQPPRAGIRVNTLKISVEEFKRLSPFELEPIPWCETGFYVKEGSRPGLHPYYHAGLYYIQEPSAMAPAELLGVEPGDRVLDLCAAPGGKSTQLAARLQGTGHLVSNDLHPERTKALAKNLEMYGVRNAVVLNESPERMAAAFPGYFNKVLIDAPCSGEGMFRKDEDMLKYWEETSPLKYAGMQREILESAAGMLCPGGTLVYSTCTFSPEENEGMIAAFLKDHSEFSVIPIESSEWFSPGEAEWLAEHGLPAIGLNGAEDREAIWQTAGTARLWPHRIKGEGHYVAVLRKHPVVMEETAAAAEFTAEMAAYPEDVGRAAAPHLGGDDPSGKRGRIHPERGHRQSRAGKHERSSREDRSGLRGGKPSKTGDRGGGGGRHGSRGSYGGRSGHQGHGGNHSGGADLPAFRDFTGGQLELDLHGKHEVWRGSNLYLSPVPEEQLAGLKTVRAGWYMGQVKNGRFVPGHPLATALKPEEAQRVIHLSAAGGEAVRYLKGETLEVPEERVVTLTEAVAAKGYVLVCIDGYAAGWGKWQSGLLKNEYPSGWRWTSA